MPLTKLARRYHQNRENILATPSRNIVPLNETTELPPYVTVRKKRISKIGRPENYQNPNVHSGSGNTYKEKENEENRIPSHDFTLNSTIINGQRDSITDCQHSKRHESTHINHIFEAFGKLSLSAFTEDISAIYEVEPDESFKTAVDDPKKIIEGRQVLAEDSSLENSAHFKSENEVHVSSRIAHWVISSPFQSPGISSETILISDSEDESERTRNLSEKFTKSITSEVDEGSSRLQEESFVRDKEADCSVTSKKNPICNEDIADVWCLEDSDSEIKAQGSEKHTAEKSLQVTLHETSKRSVSLQVSLDEIESEDEARHIIPSTSSSPSESEDVRDQIGGEVRNTLSLVDEVNSQGNALYLEDSCESEDLSFLTSLSLDTPNKNCHKDAIKYIQNFKKHKDQLVTKLFHLFNREAFQSALPADLQFAWNPRLTKTAGVCINRRIRIDNEREERLSKIELSSKVVDNPERLCKTMLHEMCHAATWIKCGVRDGHGRFFQYFAQEAMKGKYQIFY